MFIPQTHKSIHWFYVKMPSFLVELGSQIFQNILYTLVHVFIIMHK